MAARIISFTDRTTLAPEPDCPNVEVPAPEPTRSPLLPPLPVAVYSTYIVSPGTTADWLEIWQSIALTAQTWPGCRSFRLVRDRNDEMYLAFMSEWDSIAAYRGFMAEAHRRWLSGPDARTIMPGDARYLDIVPLDGAVRAAR